MFPIPHQQEPPLLLPHTLKLLGQHMADTVAHTLAVAAHAFADTAAPIAVIINFFIIFPLSCFAGTIQRGIVLSA
jgi:hypothetical protein